MVKDEVHDEAVECLDGRDRGDSGREDSGSPRGVDLAKALSRVFCQMKVPAKRVDDLVEIAESRLTRTLTDVECRQYLHVDRCSEA